MKIFSKEFRDAVRNVVENVKNGVKTVTDAATKATESKPVAKVVKMYEDTKQKVVEEIDNVKKIQDREEAMKAKTALKKKLRDEARAKAKRIHDQTKFDIKAVQTLPDVEEVYCQRSEIRPSWKPEEYENQPIVLETAKVTVIGVVKRLSNGQFRLQVSLSRRNPEDQFVKNQGYLIALRRAYDPHSTFEIDGQTFETIKIGDFAKPFLKDLFLAVADELIAQYEYTVESYTKAMKNSLQKTAQDFVDYVAEEISK